MRETVRYAARLAVYDEHTMSVKSHQLPMTILRATEATMPSPPKHTHTRMCVYTFFVVNFANSIDSNSKIHIC